MLTGFRCIRQISHQEIITYEECNENADLVKFFELPVEDIIEKRSYHG